MVMYTYLQIHQIVYVNYIVFVCQSYLNKVGFRKGDKEMIAHLQVDSRPGQTREIL